jgi:hypothetical protein
LNFTELKINTLPAVKKQNGNGTVVAAFSSFAAAAGLTWERESHTA